MLQVAITLFNKTHKKPEISHELFNNFVNLNNDKVHYCYNSHIHPLPFTALDAFKSICRNVSLITSQRSSMHFYVTKLKNMS